MRHITSGRVLTAGLVLLAVVLGLYILAKTVRKEVREHMARIRSGEIVRVK